MNGYYISSIKSDNKYKTFFEINKIKFCEFDEILNIADNLDDLNNFILIIDVNLNITVHCDIRKKFSKNCLFLFLSNTVKELSIFDNYNYVIPMNLLLYLKYLDFLSFKLLFPINYNLELNNITKFNLLLDNKNNILNDLFNKYFVKNCNDGELILYDNISKLSNDKMNYLLGANSNHIATKFIKIDNQQKKFRMIKNICMLYEKICTIENKFNNNCNDDFFNKTCKINITMEKKIIKFDPNEQLTLKANKIYIIYREGYVNSTLSYNDKLFIVQNFIKNGFNCFSFKIKGLCDNEIAIVIKTITATNITFANLFEKIEYFDSRYIGLNNKLLRYEEQNLLYTTYGKYLLFDMISQFDNIYDKYLELIISYSNKFNLIKKNKFNLSKFVKLLFFWSGLNSKQIDIIQLNTFVDNNKLLFEQQQIIILSKNLTSYGGNQKTTLQIYNELIKSGYDVKIYNSIILNNIDKFDPTDIIVFKNYNELVNNINSTNYKYIIVNKLNEYMNYIDKINKPNIVITHNSMDPFNSLIIKNQKFIEKVMTVNNSHVSLLFENSYLKNIYKYINYQNINAFRFKNENFQTRTNFKNNVLFVGRISTEKNIELLIGTFSNYVEKYNNKIKLYIIGDGKINFELNQKHSDNIIFLGKLNFDEIVYYLLNCDYLILPSYTEGMPFVIIEAMSLGIPVITSNIVGPDEIVFDHVTGFLFDLHDYMYYKNSIDTFKIIDEEKKYFDKNFKSLLNCLKTAYSINIDQWNAISMNCLNVMNKYYNENVGYKINIDNIINNNKIKIYSTDYDDYKSLENNYLKFDKLIKHNNTHNNTHNINVDNNCWCIIKINRLCDIQYIKNDTNIFLAKLNYLSFECENENINKIIDNWDQEIIFNFKYISQYDTKLIENIAKLF